MLDGEGGFTVWGRAMPADLSIAQRALPIGLAHNVTLKRDIGHGRLVTCDDVELDSASQAVRLRREAEALL
jgi:predicted homoserine dehydrogenase-like protein